MIVRNEEGRCIAAFARPVLHALSALHVEAEALRAGLLMAIHQGWSNVDLESDCVVLISALASNSLDFSEIDRVVEDCKEYMAVISSISFRHIYHEANDTCG